MNKNSIRVNGLAPRKRSRNSMILFFLFILLFSFLNCSDLFQERIPFTESTSSLDDLLHIKESINKLSTPAQFYIAPFYSSNRIHMTWTAVRGAAYYMVERAEVAPVIGLNSIEWEEPEDGDFEILVRFIYGTSHIDEVLRNPSLDSPEYQNKYFYRVTALNPAMGYEESDPTDAQSAMLFRTPDGLRASGGTSTEFVDLSWNLTQGAVSYEIWRSELPSGASASFIETVLGNQNWYRNHVSIAEQGRDFYYFIIAKNSHGNLSLQTRPAYGYARVFGSPDAPDVWIPDGEGRGDSRNTIKIEWTEADKPDVYFSVFRYSSVDSSLTRLTGENGTTANEWSDSMGLRPGIFYYYKVQAIIFDEKSGREFKGEMSSSDPEGFILSSPGSVTAERSTDGNSITIKWLPAIGTQTEQLNYTYNVYADNDINGSFTNCVANNISPITDAQGFITAEGLSVSNTFFKVSTVKGSIESDKSITVSPAPAAAIIIEASQHAYIEEANANSAGVFPVRITWRKPENEEPSFYHLQRSNNSGTGFSRVNAVALNAAGPFDDDYSFDPNTGIYSFIDRSDTRVGRKYYYRVLSLNQLQQGNFPSEERIGWGALTAIQYMIEYSKTMDAALRKLTFMWKSGNTDKLGSETKNGAIGGTVFYNASLAGLGARIIIRLTNYADLYIENEPNNGVYFTLNGESNTSANMSANGTMDGTVTCTGMYPGRVRYDRIEIRSGNAAGGTYGIWQDGFPNWAEIPWNY